MSLVRLFRQVSLRQMATSRARTCLVLAGIALGVALISAIDIVTRSVVGNFKTSITSIAGPAHLQITLGLGEVGFPEEVLQRVRRHPQVEVALPLVRGTVGLAQQAPETIQLFGVDLMEERALARYELATSADLDRYEWTTHPFSIAVTTEFAERHGIHVGSDPGTRPTLEVVTPIGVYEIAVRGLLEPHGLPNAFGGRLGLIDLLSAQIVLGKEGRIDQIDVSLKEGADLQQVQRELQSMLPSLLVEAPATRGVRYEGILGSFDQLLFGLSLLCLVAGVYIVYNTTATAAVQRALVLAALRLIGAAPRQLLRLLMLEAFVLGSLGTIAGIVAGVALAYVLRHMVAQSLGVIFQLRFPVEVLDFDVRAQLGIACVGVAASLLATYLVARRVVDLDPLEVMRADPRMIAERKRTWPLVALWSVLVGLSLTALALQDATSKGVLLNLGNLGAALWFASSIVIAVPIVKALMPALIRVLSRLFGIEGRFAGETLGRAPTRTGVTVAAITLVSTVAITFSSLSTSHQESVKSYFVGGFLGSDLAVSATTDEGGWLETPLPDTLEAAIRKAPGVARTETVRILPGVLYQGERITVAALSGGLFAPERFEDWYRAGDPAAAAAAIRAGTGVIVSENFADRFAIDPAALDRAHEAGPEIVLDTATGPVSLRVVGIVSDYMSDRGAIALSRDLFVKRWNDNTVNWVLVYLSGAGPFSPAAVEAAHSGLMKAVAEEYPPTYLRYLKVQTPGRRAAYQSDRIADAYRFTFAIQLLVIVVTVAGIFDLLMAAIWERRRELAVWRVVGADQSSVRRSVIIESVSIGCIGAGLGLVLGVITSWLWVRFNYRYLLGYFVEYHLALGTAASLVVLIIVTTFLVGRGAARQATRQSVLAGIQAD